MPTVCLAMIVKDEAHVIRRCLDSVKPFIDTWLIVDTGSLDATVEVVEEAMQGLPGQLLRRPWVDFGHNRTESLDAARPMADFVLVLDADEVLVPQQGFVWPADLPDAGRLHMVIPGSTYWLTKVMRSSLPWRYEGVLHEHPTCDQTISVANVPGIEVHGLFDSARNQRAPREKYLDDARTLTEALSRDASNARYTFYLAESCRWAGESELAIEWYRRRAAMPGWDEETWFAMLQLAALLERSGADAEEVEQAYLACYRARPQRAEPLCELARYHRENRRYSAALHFAREALATKRPDDLLFLDEGTYAWRSKDELALACHFTGDDVTALRLMDELRQDPNVPPDERSRIERNLQRIAKRADDQTSG